MCPHLLSRGLRRTCAVIAATLSFFARAQPWPQVDAPPGATVQAVAGEMLLDGRQSSVIRFEVQRSGEEVLAFYRREFGASRVVENRIKGDLVIATVVVTTFSPCNCIRWTANPSRGPRWSHGFRASLQPMR